MELYGARPAVNNYSGHQSGISLTIMLASLLMLHPTKARRGGSFFGHSRDLRGTAAFPTPSLMDVSKGQLSYF